MNTIHNAHFDFDMNISGDQATSISHRALEILQARLDAASARPDSIHHLEVEPLELPRAGMEPEAAAERIAGAIHSSIARRDKRG